MDVEALSQSILSNHYRKEGKKIIMRVFTEGNDGCMV